MVADLFINILACIILFVVPIVSSWLYYRISRRNKLIQFFGIRKPYNIVIYLSNLRVEQFGAKGIDGHVRSDRGSTGAAKEILAANGIKELINNIMPALVNQGILSKLKIADIQVDILLSPLDKGDIEKATSIITLGTPAYNLVSNYVEKTLHSKVQTIFGVIDRTKDNEESLNDIPQITPSGLISGSPGTADYYLWGTTTDTSAYSSTATESIGDEKIIVEKSTGIALEGLPLISDQNIGFVERIFDRNNNRQVFYVAGLTEDATANAAYFLADKWLDLHKKHKERDFVVMLHFDKAGDRHPKILFEC